MDKLRSLSQRENNRYIGTWFRALRFVAGLKQRELAEACYVQRQTVCHWEIGRTAMFPNVTDRQQQVLADMLDVPKMKVIQALMGMPDYALVMHRYSLDMPEEEFIAWVRSMHSFTPH